MPARLPQHLRPFGTKWKSPVRDTMSPLTHPPEPFRRPSRPAEASSSSSFGNGSARRSPAYTGSAAIGIAPLHKSNLVPVFSADEAAEIARMRR